MSRATTRASWSKGTWTLSDVPTPWKHRRLLCLMFSQNAFQWQTSEATVWRLQTNIWSNCLTVNKMSAHKQTSQARLTFPASHLSKLTSQTTVLTFSRTSAQQDFVLLHSAAGIGMMWKLVFPFISDDEFYIYHVTFATKNANLANHESSDVSWKNPISLQFFFF